MKIILIILFLHCALFITESYAAEVTNVVPGNFSKKVVSNGLCGILYACMYDAIRDHVTPPRVSTQKPPKESPAWSFEPYTEGYDQSDSRNFACDSWLIWTTNAYTLAPGYKRCPTRLVSVLCEHVFRCWLP